LATSVSRRARATSTDSDRSATELAEETGLSASEIQEAVEELAARRHLVFDDDHEIVLAHPFPTRSFAFSVMGDHTLWWGGCAWDAYFLTPMAHVWDDVVDACENQRILCSEHCVDSWLERTSSDRCRVRPRHALAVGVAVVHGSPRNPVSTPGAQASRGVLRQRRTHRPVLG
jgi:hypothetical protein